MGAPLAIRTDPEAADLRRPARRERDGRVAARLIALANVLDGMSRAAAARAAGMDRHPCTSAAAMLFWARDCRGFRVLPVMRVRKDLPHGSKEGAAHPG